jgi:hypothetical protein
MTTVNMKHKVSGAIANPQEKDLDIWLSKGWVITEPEKVIVENNDNPRPSKNKSKGKS